MTKEKLKTIDGQTLLDMDLLPIKFMVARLIPQGLHILAGAPKTGKSWLLLLLCLKVANGDSFWNRRTAQGSVLYLCLEDSTNRIQERLSELTENAPSNLHFATSVDSLTDGLTEQIETFITEHPDTNLIVIDTLQKVRTALMDANPYAADYKDILKKAGEFLAAGATVCAICGVTTALANAGLLDNRPHTSNGPGFLEMFSPCYKGQAFYVDEPSVADGNLITAGCTGALLWAKQIIERLDVFAPNTLEAWYAYFSTGEAKHFYALMQTLPSGEEAQ